jgi:hypothetical protein
MAIEVSGRSRPYSVRHLVESATIRSVRANAEIVEVEFANIVLIIFIF